MVSGVQEPFVMQKARYKGKLRYNEPQNITQTFSITNGLGTPNTVGSVQADLCCNEPLLRSHQCFFGYFDPEKNSQDNENKCFSG